MPSKKHRSNQDFLKRLRDYLPRDAGQVIVTDQRPRRPGRFRFVAANSEALKPCRMVLCQGLKQLKSRFPQTLGIPSQNPGP
ncbi:MAG: hypothetical protein HY674_09385 [Chloroflexi bacterium]|nr:hypothetical protein [Chloroflexota bacterium]